MKLFAFIMAIFFLGLSLAPCDDSENYKEDIVVVSDYQTHQSQDADTDLCSPFCICNCCQTHLVSDWLKMSESVPTPEPINKTAYITCFSKGFHNPVFHPPIG